MTTNPSTVLEFPAWLYGTIATIRRKVRAEGKWWAREYIKTGAFPQPRQLRQMQPGEVLVMHSGAEFGAPRDCWRMHMFVGIFLDLNEGVQEEERLHARAAFETFCLNTPWGALYHAVSPPPPRSARRIADRLASVLRFWDVLQGPRYAFWSFDDDYTLEALMDDVWRKTLEAWCPGGPAPLREHLALTVERVAHATREECLEAVLRVIPLIVEGDNDLKHPEVLRDPGFLRERLSALPPEKFVSLSGAEKYTVSAQLSAWDRELGRQGAGNK
ncbi:hypothetical protein D187_003492 [Cystobacter fuscus DSM 2262]|uniref:Uncharacterized protein n=1 Tax=Cystobacter fuscus (strain ATCC 25194 / DSM 2262 / NBRC 100088 / M29) TaxID=1242864 RepID=S9P3X2_CYSF2|nr:hypothetical protein [Cystobacter fuscus]EPX59115.1 hypothetical protein D187_003492 [Cystobacter fuscus DSM 2262]